VRTTLFGLLDGLVEVGLPPGPVVEFGAARAAAQQHLPRIAEVLHADAYFGTDLAPGPGVSHVHDLHHLGLGSSTVATAVVLDTIEHVRRPWEALAEVERVLAPGGLAIVTSVFFFPIHEFPDDHWRFNDSALDELLTPFDQRYARVAGPALLPHTVAGIAAKDPVDPARWQAWCDALDRWIAHGATSWKERALDLVPPALLVRGYSGFQSVAERRNRRSGRAPDG
jgi:SAM-dependent methyltransferase